MSAVVGVASRWVPGDAGDVLYGSTRQQGSRLNRSRTMPLVRAPRVLTRTALPQEADLLVAALRTGTERRC